jgi:hypothetical protein
VLWVCGDVLRGLERVGVHRDQACTALTDEWSGVLTREYGLSGRWCLLLFVGTCFCEGYVRVRGSMGWVLWGFGCVWYGGVWGRGAQHVRAPVRAHARTALLLMDGLLCCAMQTGNQACKAQGHAVCACGLLGFAATTGTVCGVF